MRRLTLVCLVLVGLSLSACSKFKSYDGPAVTQVVVMKKDQKMYLFHHDTVLTSYDIGLGFAPEGDKQIEGDGKTPEGTYEIDRRNPNSEFHLSLGISYPNVDDIAEAQALGQKPGGDIFIHGQPSRLRRMRGNWTAGCIAVTNGEIEEIYSMVATGTPITIHP